MKFRRKPIEQIIEAIPFDVNNFLFPYGVWGVEKRNGRYEIKTASGWAQVVHGDWIIKEQDGPGFYPCKDKIFKERYEAIDE